MENNSNNPLEKLGKSIKSSITLKLLSIGILILLLLIPVSQVKDLITERESYQQEAVNEVSEKWGGAQHITGPILTIPYKTFTTNSDNKVIEYLRHAHFLPEDLKIEGEIIPQIRKRGIYSIPLYSTVCTFKGKFSKPNFNKFSVDPEHILWENAFVSVGIPDMAGVNSAIEMKWDKQMVIFEPGVPVSDVIHSGVNSRVEVNDSSSQEFKFSVNLNGSKNISFVPLGKKTSVQIKSSWSNPSFNGKYLPDSHSVTDTGFEAQWDIFDYNRNYPQQWLGASHKVESSGFGVDLYMPVNHYQKNMRSAKYAILIIALSFLVYFFFEILNNRKVHPFQYILVGLSLSLFYALLLSITEHLGFDLAYLMATIMVISLIVGYSSAIFKDKRLTGLLTVFMSLIYGFIYVILQLQDYSLLVGSIGLFGVLAITMYLSRKLDWYALSSVKN